MLATPPDEAPRTLPDDPEAEVPGEARALAAARAAGLPVAPVIVVPPGAETAFYRLNGLPPRLAKLFYGVASRDPDEDDVEAQIPAAQALVAAHALADSWVDAFYDALPALPARVTVRRPDLPADGTPDGASVLRGRPALLALRRLWAAAWSFEAVLARLRRTGAVAIAAQPVLLHPEAVGGADAALAAQLERTVPGVDARVDADGRIVALSSRPSAARPGAASGRR